MKLIKKILLTSPLIFSITSITSSSVFVSKQNKDFQFNNQKNHVKKTRDISNNFENLEELQIPTDLVYVSEKLSAENTPVLNLSSNTDFINKDNLKKWQDFSTNISKLEGTSFIKEELSELFNLLNTFAEYQNTINQLNNMDPSNPMYHLKDSFIDVIKSQNNYFETMSDIPGVENIENKLLQLSGIVEGKKIKRLSSNKFTKIDALNPSTKSESNGIENVAGQGFSTLVKIAEIDYEVLGNYGIMFEYKKTQNSVAKKGVLYIKNDQEQLKNVVFESIANSSFDISKLSTQLDVFGRWEDSNDEIIDDDLNSFNNFLINYNPLIQKYEIFVRLKEEESMSNIRFATDSDTFYGTNLVVGSKFGILDIQFDKNSTFRSIIGLSSEDTKLLNLDSSSVINSIEFFSSSLSSSRINNVERKRQLTFWQGNGLSFDLPLYYASSTNSNLSQNIFSYKPINIYQNGSLTNSQQDIKLLVKDSPSILKPNLYDMYSGLKNDLIDSVANDFVNKSTIKLASSYFSKNQLAQQTLEFYDDFYAIGNREKNGWNNIDRAQTTKFIEILDPTNKIFNRKPNVVDETNSQTENSTILANEIIDQRTIAINLLSDVYQEFSNPNSTTFKNLKLDLGNVSIWSGDEKNNNFVNIKKNNKHLSGTPYEIYQFLNKNWNTLARISENLFKLNEDHNRYLVGNGNYAHLIVENWLTKITEFTVDSVIIDNTINEVINLIKNKVTNNLTNEIQFSNLNQEVKDQLANYLGTLIKAQFGTINNEFESKQYNPIYDSIKNVFEKNLNNSNFTSLKSGNQIFTTIGQMKLISYNQYLINNLIDSKNVNLTTSIKSIFDLLYFKNTENGPYLGNSIFKSQITKMAFDSFNSEKNGSNLLVSFVSDQPISKKNKVLIYSELISALANENFFDIQNLINQMLETGKPINSLELENELLNSFQKIIVNITTNLPNRHFKINDQNIKTFYLDDLISSANIYIALNFRLNQLMNENNKSANNKIIERIQDILNSNSQFNSSELSIWSNILYGTYNYENLTANLSGRNGQANLINLSNDIIKDQTILSTRIVTTNASLLILEPTLKYIWWTILILSGLGILTTSSIGVFNKNNKTKLINYPIIKWLLILGFILGLSLMLLGIIFIAL